MTRAFISWGGICADRDPFGPFGKLASIWFPEIVLQVPQPESIPYVLENQVERGLLSDQAREYLSDIWTPVQKALPGYEWMINPWEHQDVQLAQIAAKVTLETTLELYPEAGERAFAHEVAWAGGGLISAVATWGALNASTPCTFLAETREARVVAEILARQEKDPFAAFGTIVEHRVPNLQDMSWDRVIELREHEFLRQFRDKLTALNEESRAGDIHAIHEQVDELVRHDLVEIAKLARPAPENAIWKAIGSNVPLPIPVNPLSLGLGIKDIYNQYANQSRFGWLYFLLDLEG